MVASNLRQHRWLVRLSSEANHTSRLPSKNPKAKGRLGETF
jgi:hypothetical protein